MVFFEIFVAITYSQLIGIGSSKNCIILCENVLDLENCKTQAKCNN